MAHKKVRKRPERLRKQGRETVTGAKPYSREDMFSQLFEINMRLKKIEERLNPVRPRLYRREGGCESCRGEVAGGTIPVDAKGLCVGCGTPIPIYLDPVASLSEVFAQEAQNDA